MIETNNKPLSLWQVNLASAFNMFCVQIFVNLRRNLEKNDTLISFVTGFRDFRNCRYFGNFKALNAYFHLLLGLKCSLVTRIYENKLQIALKIQFWGEILEIRPMLMKCVSMNENILTLRRSNKELLVIMVRLIFHEKRWFFLHLLLC